jgi:hypothetical protein
MLQPSMEMQQPYDDKYHHIILIQVPQSQTKAGALTLSNSLTVGGSVIFNGLPVGAADTQAVFVNGSNNLVRRVLNSVAFNGESDPVWTAESVNYVNRSTSQVIAGTKTFSQAIVGNLSGNATTATNFAAARSCPANQYISSINTNGTVTCASTVVDAGTLD